MSPQQAQQVVNDAVKQAFNPWKSMTLWGFIGAVAPYVVNTFNPAALSHPVQVGVQLAGMAVGVFGLRNAPAKAVRAIANVIAGLSEKVV